MADATPRSTTCPPTWPVPPVSQPLQPIQQELAGLDDGVHRPPTDLRTKAHSVPAVSLASNGSNSPYKQRPVLLSLQLLDGIPQEHRLGLQEDEQATMLESPAGSWKESSQRENTPKIRTRDVAYTSSTGGSPNPDRKPPRQDSAYYSTRGTYDDESSELDVDIQAKQTKARERVAILRGRVLRTRRIIRSRRTELRQLREQLRDAVDKLTRKISELVALNKLEDVTSLNDRLRAVQDELGPAEEAYDRLESRLDEEEQDLEQEEDYFYRHNDVSIVSVPDSRLDDVISPLIKPYQPPETELQSLSLESGLVREYLDKVAEAERLKEELDDLENDYYRFSEDASFRKRHDIALNAESSIFLEDYPKARAEILENLHFTEDDLFDLREQCIDEGLFGESDHVYEPRDALLEDVMDSVYEARDRSPLRVAAHHVNYPEHATKFGDKRDYVNNWLLEWVQDSSVGTLMLRAWVYFEYPKGLEQGKELDDQNWPELALENWSRDAAGESANHFYNASKLDAIAGDTGNPETTTTGLSGISDSLDVALGEGGVGKEEVIMGSETGSYATQKELATTPKKRRPSSVPADLRF